MKSGCMLVIIYFLFTIVGAALNKSGPYICTMVSVRPCTKPTLPSDKSLPILYSPEIYNTSTENNVLRVNFTVVRDTKNKKIITKGFCWEDGKWNINFVMNMGCNNAFMPVIAAVTGIRYDKRTCIFKKGTYVLDKFDTNRMQHMWMTKQEYGRIMWRVEYFSEAGTVFCHEYVTLIEPEHS